MNLDKMPGLPSQQSLAMPPIPPVRDGLQRPLFSVMLPTFEPDDFLTEALESVLTQAFPADQMQIAVVDDGSGDRDVAALVRRVDPEGRVELHVGGEHLGIAGNWNRAIGYARGRLVHLLHQDDMVLPGFYTRMERAFSRVSDLGMAFCRSRIVDAEGRVMKTTSRPRWWPGVVADWLPQIAVRQRIQTPAAVVARSTYELVGGYRADLRQTLDWEMWVRIAARKPVWYEPQPLAIYRRHPANETFRLKAAGIVWSDIAHAIRLNAQSLPGPLQESVMTQSSRWHAGSACRDALAQFTQGEPKAALATLAEGRQLVDLITDVRQQAAVERRMAALKDRILAIPGNAQTP